MDAMSKLQLNVPSTMLPMVRRVFPTMIPDFPLELPSDFASQVEKWTFLSRKRLKRQIKNFGTHWKHSISINKLVCEEGKPMKFTSRTFTLFHEDSIEKFMVELANLADLHGIVKLRQGEIWVKQISSPDQLNIDVGIIERFVERMKEQVYVKFAKADFTLKLEVE